MLRAFCGAFVVLALSQWSVVSCAEAAAAPRLTVAISYFDNNTGKAEYAPLAKGIADMLITDLSGVSSLQIVERAHLNKALGELKLSRSKYIDPTTAQKLGKGLAAQFILTGGYVVANGRMRIDARVFQVATGKVLASEQVEGSEDEFFSLEKDLVDLLIRTLDVKVASSERTKLRTNATQSLAAFKGYAAGLDAADAGRADEARKAFEAALLADPNYRAARTATERLSALFAHQDQQVKAAADSAFRTLDPKSRDFPQKVEELLMSLESGKTDQLGRKIALLQWLAERDLLACQRTSGPADGNPTVIVGGIPQGGVASHCRQVQEVLVVGFRLMEDPTQWDLLPKVCEHFIHRLPGDKSLSSYCENTIIGSLKDRGGAEERSDAAKSWKEDREWDRQNLRPGDWRLALIDNEAGMKKLIATYAAKNRK